MNLDPVPLEEPTTRLQLKDLFDLAEIQRIQDAFAQATGVASIITDVDGTPLTRPSNFCRLCEHLIRKTSKGLENCYHSDAVLGRKHHGGPLMQPCLSGGLWDGGTSICVGEQHVANWLIGQVLEDSADEQTMLAYAKVIGANEEEFKVALGEVTRMPKERFAKICEALHLIATQLSRLAIQNVQQARLMEQNRAAEQERLNLQRQVLHAQKLESLGVLAGGIAHDFNNLLTAILGHADMALSDLPEDSPVRESLSEIDRASRRAADLAKQMLAYSGKGTYVMKQIQLNDLIKGMADLLSVSVPKRVTFQQRMADSLPPTVGDPAQIRQVLLNLVTNASEAIGDREGGVQLQTGAVFCEHQRLHSQNRAFQAGVDAVLPEGIYVYAEVSDDGCGMDKATQERICEPFFTTKFMGRGLGLSVVLGIIRSHKGSLEVSSNPGGGSLFRVLLPSLPLVQGSSEIQAQAVPASSSRGTILLVDDEEPVRRVGTRMLQRNGFTVLTASDGREGVTMFQAHADTIACVLLDMTMPRLDGEAAFREIRAIRPDAKVILCSGFSEQEATTRFLGKGLAGFLSKPYTQAELLSKLPSVV